MVAGNRPPFSETPVEALELNDVLRLKPLGALGDFERNLIVFAQGFESLRLNGRMVNKQILTTVFGRDETIPFCVVEPLHCTC